MTEAEILRALEREEAALSSLIEFRRTFFADEDDVAPASFHYRWSDILLNGRRHFAVEAFRESAKTQIVIRANLLHALTYPQKHRSYIVLICATGRLASKKLKEVSREFTTKNADGGNEFLELAEKILDDSGAAIEVTYRTGQRVRIEAYGKGAAVRGLSWGARRPDLVIIDDPQDKEDADSETVTESDWEWFLTDIIFLGRNSRIFLIGNNLGDRCIVERVLGNAGELGFDTERVPILDDDNQSTWPERWPTEEVLQEREAFTKMEQLHLWLREKMCLAADPEKKMFRREMFRYFDEKLDIRGLSIYTTVDLATSKKKNADYTSVVTVGVNAAGHWFVLDVDSGRYDPTESMDAIFGAVAKWHPLCVGIETVAYQAVLEHFLIKEMPKRNLFFRIVALKAENKKERRIEALQPRFVAGTVWFRALAPWLEKLERELLAFPLGLHDDDIDSLAYQEQIAVPPIGGGQIENITEDPNDRD